jgi:hypothetical protein
MSIGPSSEEALEDPIRNPVPEEGYTNEGSAKETADDDPSNDSFWLKRARESHQASQTWFDVSIRRKAEDHMRLFNSEHPRGSRYSDESYRKRSRLFRPKTRSAIRKTEAAGVAAFFATQDALTCQPPNARDPIQKAGADSMAELLNYRLQNDIPWFVTCIGAIQDASKQGVVISRQQWNYREVQDVYDEEITDAMTGQSMGNRRTFERRVVADHPDIVLRPIENVRFSPAADWRNPIQTSPYLIDMEPFYVGDILERGEEGAQGQYDVAFRKLDIATIRSALKQSYDPIRQAREGHREDRYEENHSAIQEHDAVWVHHNYMRVDGQDWYYATLGTEIMLTDVVPLEETTPLKERPYTMGFIALETHKPYPAGLVELMRPIQEEINDITNLRIDNIRHVISPRYFVKRGSSVDVRSLLRNIAGGVTAMEDPQNDVHIRQIQDTTASSFQEQDRLSVEVDELAGTSSQSSIAANHNINERVGNTQMMKEDSNQLTEMNIRTFAETWVEPTLQQVMELERALESDEVVLAIVGQRSNMAPEMVFRMMDMPVRVTVNVGFGATNPQRRLQKVAMAFSTLAQINPNLLARADERELASEVLGAVGFKSVERFFPHLASEGNEDPQTKQLMEENQQLKAMLEGEQGKHQAQLQGKQMDVQGRVQIEQMRLEYQRERDRGADQLKYNIEQNKWKGMLLDHEIKREQNGFRRQELIEQRRALNHTIAMDERQYQMAMREQQYNMQQPVEKTPDIGNTGPTPAKGAPEPQEVKPNAGPNTDNPGGGKRIASTPKLKGDDMAGVISRGDYGVIPGKEG